MTGVRLLSGRTQGFAGVSEDALDELSATQPHVFHGTLAQIALLFVDNALANKHELPDEIAEAVRDAWVEGYDYLVLTAE